MSEKICTVRPNPDRNGGRLLGYDGNAFSEVHIALMNAEYAVQHRNSTSGVDDLTIQTPEGLLLGYILEPDGRDSVFYRDKDTLLGQEIASPLQTTVALGQRLTSAGWKRRDLDGKPVMLLETTVNGKPLEEPGWVAIGVGRFGLANLCVFSTSNLPEHQFDPKNFIIPEPTPQTA